MVNPLPPCSHRGNPRTLPLTFQLALRGRPLGPGLVGCCAGGSKLTASERRIAELAADGLTGGEVARALFVTTRTVEGHLTNVFNKVDFKTRTRLALATPSKQSAPNRPRRPGRRSKFRGASRGFPRCEGGSGE